MPCTARASRSRATEVNGKRLSIPSAQLRVGDTITIGEKSRRLQPVLHSIAVNENRQPAEWLSVDRDTLSATINRLPDRSDVEIPVQETLIVELYSK
jgi:small subunit ribosomal protein S4